MEGKGFWEADHIELNQLSARSNEVNMKEVKMAPLSLELKDRLRWDYEEEHIRGLLQAKTDWIELAYGGRFVSPVFGLGIDGKSISNFNFAGDLKAGSLGPLDVLGVYQIPHFQAKSAGKNNLQKYSNHFSLNNGIG